MLRFEFQYVRNCDGDLVVILTWSSPQRAVGDRAFVSGHVFYLTSRRIDSTPERPVALHGLIVPLER
jgi:hypothetical protein